MRLILTSFLLLIISFLQAQTASEKYDEAKSLFEERKYDEARVAYFNINEALDSGDSIFIIKAKFGIASTYIHQGKSDEAFPIYYQIKEDCQKIKNDSLLAEANFSLATMYEFRSQYDSVEVILWNSFQLPNLDAHTRSDIFTLLGRAKGHKLDYDSALVYLKKAIELDEIRSDSSSLPYNYMDLAQQYRLQNHADSAVYYCLKGMSYLRKGTDDFKIPAFYERISRAFIQSRNLNKAEEYANLALEKAQELQLNVATERAYILIGEIKRFKREYETALQYYSIADSLNHISNRLERQALITRGIIECKLALGEEINPVLIKNLKEFSISTQSDVEKADCDLILLKAGFKTLKKAEFCSISEKLEATEAVQNNLHYMRKFQEIKYEFEVFNGLWENAIETNNDLNNTLNDLAGEKTLHVVHDLEAKYQKLEQDKQIEFLDKENSLKEKVITGKNGVIISVVLGLLLVSVLGLILLRLLKKMNNQKSIISDNLDEKETLLREIHHRVKNNLQVISSLLRLQSNSTDDEVAIEALTESQSRVQSMSLIHQNLYGEDNLTGIGMKKYLEQLTQNLLATYKTSENVKLITDIEDLKLDVDTVVPLGLIINELITNSLKYAFPDQKDGEITVILKKVADKLLLVVKDNGIGISEDLNVEDGSSFGFGLINAFTTKLDADLEIKNDNGSYIELVIREFDLRSI